MALRIGTCSWKYDSWRGLVYSDKPDLNYLQEYSQHYNTVEIDQWFWSLHSKDNVSLPKPSVAKNYLNSVPEDFKFTIKVPNSITLTHFYRKSKSEALVSNPHFLSLKVFNEFLSIISPMKMKLGPLMFQFEYLNRQKISSQQEFQTRLQKFIAQCDNDFTYAVEIRNPNYLNSSYFEFLRRVGCYPVLLQGYYMPHIVPIYRQFESYFKDTAVIRLHGPNRKRIEAKSKENWNKILEPKDEELRDITQMIQSMLSQNMSIYLNVNNHYEGSAPLTIRKIQGFMEKSL